MRFERIVGGEGPPRLVGVRRLPARPAFTHADQEALKRAQTDPAREAPAARPEGRHVRPSSYVMLSLALSVLFFGFFLVGDRGILSVRKQRRQLASARLEVAQLEEETRRLEGEVAALKGDPRAVEKIAREDLGLVRPGEVVLVLPDGWEKRVRPSKPPAPASASPATVR